MKWHHSNSRRFKCSCGRIHSWGCIKNSDKDRWEPRHQIFCDCGVEHVRG